MKHTTRWIKVTSIALLVVLGITALGSATVTNAQDGGNTPDAGPLVRQALALVLLRETHKATGLSNADILKELRSGKTLAEVITGHGATVEAIKSAATTDVTNRVKQMVTNKRLTQDQADKLLANLDAALDKLINARWPGTAQQNRVTQMLRAAGVRLLVNETAKEGNIARRDLLKELREGKTLAQIATEHNADPAKIVAAAVTAATDAINKQVANKRLTQDQANKLIATLPDGLTKIMNQPYPLGRGAGGKANPGATPQATPEATPAA